MELSHYGGVKLVTNSVLEKKKTIFFSALVYGSLAGLFWRLHHTYILIKNQTMTKLANLRSEYIGTETLLTCSLYISR